MIPAQFMATIILPTPTPAAASRLTPPLTQPSSPPATSTPVISGPLKTKIEAEFERLVTERRMINPAKNSSLFSLQGFTNPNLNAQQAVLPYIQNEVSHIFKLPFYYNGSVVFDGAIACQGPRQQEQAEFWQMVWQSGVKAIVMLDYPQDRTLYWPHAVDKMELRGIQDLPPITITKTAAKTLYRNEDDNEAIMVRHFILTRPDGTAHEVDHFFIEGWPEHNYETHTGGAISEETLAKAINLLTAGAKGRILCHCKVGVGRTGAFLASYQSHLQLASGRKDPNLIFDIAFQGRSQEKGRTGMIHTLDQYGLIYKTLFFMHPEFMAICEQSLPNKPS